jgi:hypothetical protein
MADKNENNARPVPNRGLILELTGGSIRFLEQIHHGLWETPMQALYPHLNLDELLVFEAGSWEFRNDGSSNFRKLIGAGNIYDIFNRINQDGFPYLQRIQKLKRWKNKNAELNPFGRSRTLKQRLERVTPEEVGKLLERLSQPASTYVFECKYADVKRKRGGNNFGLEILHFMPVYPKSNEVNVENYASEIAAIISQYPIYYVPVVNSQPESEIQPTQPETIRTEEKLRGKPRTSQGILFPTEGRV